MRRTRFVHFSSLDVVLGAILYQLFWSKITFGHFPPLNQVVALFSAIWLIYLLDRKIDSNIEKSTDSRHLFQLKHKNKINILILGLASISVGNLFFLPLGLLQIGVLILMGIGLYWLIWWMGWFRFFLSSKEFFTAFFYTLGVGASTLYQSGLNNYFITIFVLLFLCVFQNLLLFSSLENTNESKWKYILVMVEIVFLLNMFFFLYAHPQIEYGILIPFLFTFCLQVWIHYFAYSIHLRFLGELAFLSPIIYFIYEFFSK